MAHIIDGRTYDAWKLDYPSDWDDECFTCNECECLCSMTLAVISREDGSILMCEECLRKTDKVIKKEEVEIGNPYTRGEEIGY